MHHRQFRDRLPKITHEPLKGKICVLSSIDYFVVNLCRKNDFNFQHACLLPKFNYIIVRIWFPNVQIIEFSNLMSPFWFHYLHFTCEYEFHVLIRNVIMILEHVQFSVHYDMLLFDIIFLWVVFNYSKIIMIRMKLYLINVLY